MNILKRLLILLSIVLIPSFGSAKQIELDFMVFETNKKQKYNISCKGAGNLNFESPIIIEPQKLGYKICSNDVLKLRNKTCFIDKIELVKKDNEVNS